MSQRCIVHENLLECCHLFYFIRQGLNDRVRKSKDLELLKLFNVGVKLREVRVIAEDEQLQALTDTTDGADRVCGKL